MLRSREIPRQQIGEPVLQPTTQTETSEESKHIAVGSGLNRPSIKMLKFLPYDPEIWFNILERV